MQLVEIIGYFFVMLWGLAIGSFLNVVIYRLPRMIETAADRCEPQKSIFNLSRPRSHCPHCQHALRIRDNIPLISFIFLKAHCTHCHAKISWRYPLIETLSAGLALLIVFYFGFTFSALAGACFVFILLPLIFIDIQHQVLPDPLTYSLLWLGLLNAALLSTYATAEEAILGALVGYSIFYIFNFVFSWITKRQGLGYGDFKLLAALGAWFGIYELPFIIFSSATLGAFIGVTLILLKKHKRSQPLPYGPFLAFAGLACLFFQPQIHQFYEWLYY